MKLVLISIFLISSLFTVGQKLAGIYQTNYGMFGLTLTLNCDSSAIYNFNGDLMNDNSIGKWILKNRLLMINFDSIQYPKQRYKAPISFTVKHGRLYTIIITRKQYNRYKALNSQTKGVNNNIPSYSKFRKELNQSFKHFGGYKRSYYYKKMKAFDCDE